MSATITLPATLRSRLSATLWRIRLLRAVRGLALVVIVFGFYVAAAGMADSWLDLSPLTRLVLFSLALALGLGAAVRWVVVPVCRRIDTAALAAVIEEKYPDLGERLTSAVELAHDSDEGHGSPIFISLLLEETAKQSEYLDFRPAVPVRRVGILAVLAVGMVLLLGSPMYLWPEPYGVLAQRLLQPWVVPPVAPPFDLSVSPGDVVAALGRTVTLSAHLTPRPHPSSPQSGGGEEWRAMPDVAALLVVDAEGKESRHELQRDENGDFTIDYKVAGDFSYRIEAGEIVSDSYRITAITPVELASDSPTITITPPEYARSVKGVATFHGLVDLSALQHSDIRFDFRFTRPAVAAYLELNHGAQGNTVRHNLRLSDDRLTASWGISDLTDGKYRLILEAEHGIRTELEGGSIRIQPDQSPSVRRFAGKEELHAVLPYERVPLEIEAVDDIGVASVELEYRINNEESLRQPLELQGGVSPLAIARYLLELAGKVKEDDRVSYRFRIRDNLPEKYGGPHVIFYPTDRWLGLTIARSGDSLEKQEIIAQRDDLVRRLQAIRQALLAEKQDVVKQRDETHNSANLPEEALVNLKKLAGENRTTQRALREAADVADVTPALRPVGELARDVADREMQKSQQDLEQAPKESSPSQRTRQLQDTEKQLKSAVKRVENLIKANERLAQDRLDHAKLEMLAQREKQLAERAAELAAKHPVLDPKARELAEKIKKEQEETAKELEQLSQQSEPLKQAVQQARQEQSRDLAARARDLAKAQRDLAQAQEQTQKQQRKERLADLARKQQELAEQGAKLAEQIRPALPVARTEPLKAEELQRAAEALKEGDPMEAIRHQEQAANDLERLGQALERAVQVSADPKEAARQLEEAEKALQQRVRAETEKKDAKKPLSERLKPLQEEQKAIRRAAEQLSLPPNHAEANKAKQQIGERAAQAAEELRKPDTAQAQARMEETKNVLRRLSAMLPRLDQRRQQALGEVERLRREQEAIGRQLEQIKKDDPKAAERRAEAARRQGEAAKQLGRLDAPNQEDRRDRAAEALKGAKDDLQEGRREDVPTSQQEAKRQLERLAQALRGEKPADERARELAQKQRRLAEEAKQADNDELATPQRQEDLKNRQQQLAEQARNLPAPEAPQLQREAAEAVQRAAQAAQTEPTSAQTRKEMEEAARKLDRLARQMAGEESDPARAERLTRSQAEAAAEAERRPGQTATPEEKRRQQEIAREAREIHGGDEAQEQKRRAVEALDRAQRAAAPERAKAQRQAAEALRDLADRLAGRDDPAAKANYLAQQQRDLAREIERMEPDKTSPQQSQDAAQRQAELAQQIRRLHNKEALPQIVQTRARMADAVVALAKAQTPDQAKQAVARAAESAEKLAQRLNQLQAANKPAPSSGRTTSLKPRQVAQPETGRRDTARAVPTSLPSQAQSDQARQLAQQQRALREAVQRRTQVRHDRPLMSDNPIEELVRQQVQVAQDAEMLAGSIAKEQGEDAAISRQAKQAQQAAQSAATRIQAGALPQAYQAGQQSAAQIQQLGEKLVVALRRGDQRSSDPLREARRLEEQQVDINRRMQSLAGEIRAQIAQQQVQQRNLQRQAGDLSRQLQTLVQQPQVPGPMQAALWRAIGNSQQAQQEMEQAGQQGQRGEFAAEKQSEERAAQALERASKDTREAANPSSHASTKGGVPHPGGAATGNAMTQASKQIATAQKELQQGKPAQAEAAMRQAAQALAKAAQHMVPGSQKPSQSGQASAMGRQPGGMPDLSAFGLDKTVYANKSWGELPGELRTKIVQDMKARYGEDYARMIKSYFEQIADTKKKDDKVKR